jgi:hypothetical protein
MIPVAMTMALGKLIKDSLFQPTPRLRIASLSSFGALALDSPNPSLAQITWLPNPPRSCFYCAATARCRKKRGLFRPRLPLASVLLRDWYPPPDAA